MALPKRHMSATRTMQRAQERAERKRAVQAKKVAIRHNARLQEAHLEQLTAVPDDSWATMILPGERMPVPYVPVRVPRSKRKSRTRRLGTQIIPR